MSLTESKADDLSQVDNDVNSVLDDRNFVVVEPGIDQAHLLTEIEQLKQELAIAGEVISKGKLAQSQESRFTAQSHLSVTQLVDENSLLESQMKILTHKLQQVQHGNMSDMRAMFEAEKQQLVSTYTAQVEDLQMNCKAQAQHALENSNRYNAEASKVEKLNHTIRELKRDNAQKSTQLHDLQSKMKYLENKIAADTEDVSLAKSLEKDFQQKLDELHGRIEAMYAATAPAAQNENDDGEGDGGDGDEEEDATAAAEGQARLIAKELSEAKVELQKLKLDRQVRRREKTTTKCFVRAPHSHRPAVLWRCV